MVLGRTWRTYLEDCRVPRMNNEALFITYKEGNNKINATKH